MLSTLLIGLALGGTYALVALGLSMQYGVARIMNLAYGEFIVFACFGVYLMYTMAGIPPLWGVALAAPLGGAVSWCVYAAMMRPLAARAGSNRGRLEADSILATFGLLFLMQGIMQHFFGRNLANYNYLNEGVDILGATVAVNRLAALAAAMAIGGGLWLFLSRTRSGMAMRAAALSPASAPLVGININRVARGAFVLGGAIAAAGGGLVSMYQTFSAADGVAFTMKALVIVIMGGAGSVLGALVAGLTLGVAETLVAALVDPGLTLAATYALFLAVLLWRPAGLLGRAVS